MRILLLGGSGQLGRELLRALAHSPQAHQIIAPSHAELNLADPETAAAAVRAAAPEAIVNCAAYNQVDAAENAAAEAFAVNALGPYYLARAARAAGADLVQIGTNYVFDGRAAAAYREDDPPRPLNVYGASKLAAEQLIALAWERHILVRTAGLYAAGGSRAKPDGGFVERILAQAAAGAPLRVVADQRISPTPAADLAPAVLSLLFERRYGCFHLTSGGDCSWHEFAAAVLEFAGLQARIEPIASAELEYAARRPANGVLANTRAPELRLPHWREALSAYLQARNYAG